MHTANTMKKNEASSTSKASKSTFQRVLDAIGGCVLLIANGLAITTWSFAKKPLLAFFKIIAMSSFAFIVLLLARSEPVPVLTMITAVTLTSVSAMIVALLSK